MAATRSASAKGAKPRPKERRLERGEQLSQERLVEAALRVAKRVGFDRLTMRALADELGVTPMAAYYYVSSKEQLLELVADSVASSRKPFDLDAPWEEQLKQSAFDLYDRLTEYPGLGAFLLERPLTPNVRTEYASATELFRRVGLDTHEAELAHATYHTFMFGLMGMEYRFRPEKRKKRGARDEDAVVAHATTREFIEFGLDLFIAGIHDRIARGR
jgi:AcrR family transcriptional regulator